MKFFTVFAVLTAVILAVVDRVQAQHQIKCEADHQCQANEYCYIKSSVCSKCVDCSTVKRVPSSVATCVKVASECGACLPGYKDVYLAGQNKKHLCQIVPTASPSNAESSSESDSYLLYIGFAFATTLIIAAFGAGFYFCRGKYRLFAEHVKGFSQRPVINEEIHSPHPPPYSEDVEQGRLIPTAPPVLDPGAPEPSGSFYIKIDELQVGEDSQKAVPFTKPRAAYYPSSEGEDDDDDDDDEENVLGHFTSEWL